MKINKCSSQNVHWYLSHEALMDQSCSSFLRVLPAPNHTKFRLSVKWHPVVSLPSLGLSCIPVLPPRRGSFYVERGTGVSIGSVLAFWCREGYQLVGSDKIYCNVRNGKPQWSNYLPVCEGRWVLTGLFEKNPADFRLHFTIIHVLKWTVLSELFSAQLFLFASNMSFSIAMIELVLSSHVWLCMKSCRSSM